MTDKDRAPNRVLELHARTIGQHGVEFLAVVSYTDSIIAGGHKIGYAAQLHIQGSYFCITISGVGPFAKEDIVKGAFQRSIELPGQAEQLVTLLLQDVLGYLCLEKP